MNWTEGARRVAIATIVAYVGVSSIAVVAIAWDEGKARTRYEVSVPSTDDSPCYFNVPAESHMEARDYILSRSESLDCGTKDFPRYLSRQMPVQPGKVTVALLKGGSVAFLIYFLCAVAFRSLKWIVKGFGANPVGQ